MPKQKYGVLIAETEIFRVDVAAEDEADAELIAMHIFGSTSRSRQYHFSRAFVTLPISDDAEVEND